MERICFDYRIIKDELTWDDKLKISQGNIRINVHCPCEFTSVGVDNAQNIQGPRFKPQLKKKIKKNQHTL